MPQATDIVIKNGATTPVDKTFTLVSPAAGDGGVALWYLKEGTVSAAFIAVTASAHKTGNASRKLNLRLSFPSSFVDGGKTVLGPRALVNLTVSIPDDFPESAKSDFTAYTANLVNHPLIKAAIRDAYSFT